MHLTGLAVPVLNGPLDGAQRVLAIVAGLLMIAMALQFFGLLQRFHGLTIGFGGSTLAMSLRNLLSSENRAAPIAFGVFNGFLPCPLVYAFAVQAASTAGAVSGFLVMLAFGLGTFPAMLMMGGVGRMLGPVWRQRGVWLAGGFILLLGLITLGRGVLPFERASACVPAWKSGMTETRDNLCSHCLLPVGLRAMQRTVNGEDCSFCCYGCCIAFQVKHGQNEEWDAAWLLIRLGVGAFLTMNIMLISLLLYAGTFSADPWLIPWIHLLLWIFATPALVILGEPYLRETWAQAAQGRVTSSALVVLGVGAAYAYSVFATIEQSDQVYFDTATMVLMLFTIGSYIEAAGRAKAARDLEPLLAAESECRHRRRRGDGDDPPGAGHRCRRAGARPAGRARSNRWRGRLRASRTPMRP